MALVVDRRARAWLAALIGALWVGCASVHPPITAWSDAPAPLTAPEAEDPARPLVRVETLRHDGVMLHLKAPPELVRRADALVLIRQADDAPPEALQTITLTDALRARLIQGVPLLDRRVTDAQTLRYALHLRVATETLGTSPTATTRWQPTPAPPRLRAQALTSRAVSLQWVPRKGWGLAIYRRALGGRWQHLATAPPTAGGLWVDRAVTPASVYVYRVAAATEQDGTPVLGRLGPEVYVTASPP